MKKISTLPTYELNSFARWVANEAEKYFENPVTKARFEKWLKERNEK